MALRFSLSHSVQILVARRNLKAAARRHGAALLGWIQLLDTDGNAKPGCGIAALAALAEESAANRALHIANLRLQEALDGPSYVTRDLLRIAGAL